MKNEMRQTTKISSKLALKTKLVWLIAGFSLASIVMLILFLYFYAAKPVEIKAGSNAYNSLQTGNWTSTTTWGGTPPPVAEISGDNITINSGHTVTRIGDLDIKNGTTVNVNSGATLLIDGVVTVNNNLSLNVEGTLTISGDFIAKNESQVVINSSGNIDISGNAQFGNNTNFIINGNMNIGENITFGSNPNFIGDGNIELGGLGCNYWEGSGTCVENMTLPVELLSFEIEKGDNQIVVAWETSSELNNDYFSIQKSKDGVQFTTIDKIQGGGTKKGSSEYIYIDKYPYNGLSYYRLVQTDLDGRTETFRPISVMFETKNEKEFNVYPNPLSGTNLFVTLHKVDQGNLQIYDLNGRVIYDKEVSASTENNIEIDLDQNIEKGIYYVFYKTKAFESSVKLVKL